MSNLSPLIVSVIPYTSIPCYIDVKTGKQYLSGNQVKRLTRTSHFHLAEMCERAGISNHNETYETLETLRGARKVGSLLDFDDLFQVISFWKPQMAKSKKRKAEILSMIETYRVYERLNKWVKVEKTYAYISR